MLKSKKNTFITKFGDLPFHIIDATYEQCI